MSIEAMVWIIGYLFTLPFLFSMADRYVKKTKVKHPTGLKAVLAIIAGFAWPFLIGMIFSDYVKP